MSDTIIPRFINQGFVREAAVLTTSYVAGDVIPMDPSSTALKSSMQDFNTLRIDVDLTKGSLTSIQLKIETSPDGVNWYQTTSETISTGVVTTSVEEWTWTANFSGTIYRDVKARYARVSVKGTGTVTGSSAAINVSYANK